LLFSAAFNEKRIVLTSERPSVLKKRRLLDVWQGRTGGVFALSLTTSDLRAATARQNRENAVSIRLEAARVSRCGGRVGFRRLRSFLQRNVWR